MAGLQKGWSREGLHSGRDAAHRMRRPRSEPDHAAHAAAHRRPAQEVATHYQDHPKHLRSLREHHGPQRRAAAQLRRPFPFRVRPWRPVVALASRSRIPVPRLSQRGARAFRRSLTRAVMVCGEFERNRHWVSFEVRGLSLHLFLSSFTANVPFWCFFSGPRGRRRPHRSPRASAATNIADRRGAWALSLPASAVGCGVPAVMFEVF